jgi:peptide/nickel transport system substrate-binding protein
VKAATRSRAFARRLVGKVPVLAVAMALFATTGTSGASVGAAVNRQGEFRYAMAWSFTSFDPAKSTNPGGDFLYLQNVYDTLLTMTKNADGTVTPGPRLAKSYKVAVDGLSITFDLRTGIKFQDGNALTAAAVKANLDRNRGTGSTLATTLASIQSVEAPSDTQVVVRLSAPDPGLPYLLSSTYGMMVSPAAFTNSDLTTKPVGSGPFTLVSANRDTGAVFGRWDGYWDKGSPSVSRLTISSLADANVRYNGLRSGQFDGAYLTAPLDAQSKELAKDGYHYMVKYSASLYTLLMNSSKPPLNDVRVRQAVSMAINRKVMAKQLFPGLGRPVHTTFAKGFIGYDKSIDDPYDPKKARQLVEQSGAASTTLTLEYPAASPYDTMAQALQQFLTDAGLKVELVPVASSETRQAWRRGNYHMFIQASGQPEPSRQLTVQYIGQGPGDNNPVAAPAQLVDMANKAKVLTPGSAQQNKAYQEIDGWLSENPIHAPLMQLWTVIVTRPNVANTDSIMRLTMGDLDFRGVAITKKK